MRDRSPSTRAVPHSGRPARSLFKGKRETGRLPQPTGGARNCRDKALGLALRQAEVIAEREAEIMGNTNDTLDCEEDYEETETLPNKRKGKKRGESTSSSSEEIAVEESGNVVLIAA